MRELPLYSSASQLACYASCPRKYEYIYVHGLNPEVKALVLVFGSAVHGALAWWFTERLEGRIPTVANAERIFLADLAAEIEPGDVSESELVEVEQQGRELVRLYLERHGDLRVAAVEQPFEIELHDPVTGELLPRRLRGYFDLVLADGSVVEIKTAARSWGRSPDLRRHLQISAYSFATKKSVEAHVLVKKKLPTVEVFRSGNNNWWLAAAVSLERAIMSGIYPPRPSPMCSTCDYEQTCAGAAGDEHDEVTVLAAS